MLLNGHDIERWCAKILIGAVASRLIRFDEYLNVDKDVPRPWLDFLFGRLPQLPLGGLYVTDPLSKPYATPLYVLFEPVGRENKLAGLNLQVAGFTFALLAEKPSEVLLAKAAFRPRELVVPHMADKFVILMSWERRGEDASVSLSLAGKPYG